MTKVTYMSDLHLEFDANVDPGEGDILVLAGDILVAKYLDPSLNDSMARSKRKGYMRFYEKTLENYKSVYYIHGNHEPYGMDIDYAKELTILSFLSGMEGCTTVLSKASVYFSLPSGQT